MLYGVWRRVALNLDLLKSVEGQKPDLDSMADAERDLYRKTNETIQQITRGLDGAFTFNTAIAAIMELMNAIDHLKVSDDSSESAKAVFRDAIENVVLLISPFAPHIAEELWEALGKDKGSLALTPWPSFREDALIADTCLIVAQVNGKLRGKFNIDATADDETIKKRALADENVQRFIDGKTIKKVIVVKKKLVNIVI